MSKSPDTAARFCIVTEVLSIQKIPLIETH